MRQYFSYEMKKIWQRREFWFVLIASALIAVIGFFVACNENANMAGCGSSLETIYPARNYTLLGGGGDFSLLVILCVLPLFATMIAGASYGEEKKAHMVPVLVSRGKISAYYSAKGLAIAITSFVGSTLPFFFSGLLGFLAVPIKETFPEVSSSLYEGGHALYSYEAGHILFPSLYFNSPILQYLATLALIGLYGMGLGLLAYGISFFFHKNKVLLMLLPMIVSFAATLGLAALQLENYIVASYFTLIPNPSRSLNVFGVLGILLGILLLDLLLLFIGVKRNEDVL